MIAIYVDDILILQQENFERVEELISRLKGYFDLEDLGEASYFLGMEIQKDNGVVRLSQSKYIKDILRKLNMHNCKAVTTPLVKILCYNQLKTTAMRLERNSTDQSLGQ